MMTNRFGDLCANEKGRIRKECGLNACILDFCRFPTLVLSRSGMRVVHKVDFSAKPLP